MAKKDKKFKEKLFYKYRLVIVNDDTFEEKLSFNLSRLNVFVLTGLSAVILIAMTSILIAFTPLREYIPGYSSTKLQKEAMNNREKLLTLEKAKKIDSLNLISIKKVLIGDLKAEDINKDSLIAEANRDFSDLNLNPSIQDSLLRAQVEREDKFNFFDESKKENVVLFTPANGPISEAYNIKEKHYAVDIVLTINEPIKAVADGTVIFAEWTTETGYVLIIEHTNDLISVYKHNASITKSQGDLVKSGEVIATAGSTGELSTGPHLHFELWSKGYPVNPTNYIDFK